MKNAHTEIVRRADMAVSAGTVKAMQVLLERYQTDEEREQLFHHLLVVSRVPIDEVLFPEGFRIDVVRFAKLTSDELLRQFYTMELLAWLFTQTDLVTTGTVEAREELVRHLMVDRNLTGTEIPCSVKVINGSYRVCLQLEKKRKKEHKEKVAHDALILARRMKPAQAEARMQAAPVFQIGMAPA